MLAMCQVMPFPAGKMSFQAKMVAGASDTTLEPEGWPVPEISQPRQKMSEKLQFPFQNHKESFYPHPQLQESAVPKWGVHIDDKYEATSWIVLDT